MRLLIRFVAQRFTDERSVARMPNLKTKAGYQNCFGNPPILLCASFLRRSVLAA